MTQALAAARLAAFVVLFVVSAATQAAVRDFPIAWSQELLDVDGNPIAQIDGFRLFTADGVFVQTFPGQSRTAVVRVNVPWGETCFRMRSFYLVDGVEFESADSNVGACKTVKPGKPVPPAVNQ